MMSANEKSGPIEISKRFVCVMLGIIGAGFSAVNAPAEWRWSIWFGFFSLYYLLLAVTERLKKK